MYCPECKKEFDSKFCPECGVKLVEIQIKNVESGTKDNVSVNIEEEVVQERKFRPLSPIQKLLIDQIKRSVSEANSENLRKVLPRVGVQIKNTDDEEIHYLYGMLTSALNPMDLINDYESVADKNYWKTYWSYFAYLNIGSRANAESLIFDLERFKDYDEENIKILYAFSTFRDFGPIEAQLILDSLNGTYHEFLKDIVAALNRAVKEYYLEGYVDEHINFEFYDRYLFRLVKKPHAAPIKENRDLDVVPDVNPASVQVNRPNNVGTSSYPPGQKGPHAKVYSPDTLSENKLDNEVPDSSFKANAAVKLDEWHEPAQGNNNIKIQAPKLVNPVKAPIPVNPVNPQRPVNPVKPPIPVNPPKK